MINFHYLHKGEGIAVQYGDPIVLRCLTFVVPLEKVIIYHHICIIYRQQARRGKQSNLDIPLSSQWLMTAVQRAIDSPLSLRSPTSFLKLEVKPKYPQFGRRFD